MKSIMLAGVAMLSFATVPVLAQQMPTSPAPGDTMTPPADQAAPTVPEAPATPSDPGMATPPADPPSAPSSPAPGADPNAGQPTGAVPADTGMAPAPAGVPSDPAAPVGSSANPVTVGGNVTAPPSEAKDYPVCSKTVQDSCVNRGEAGKARRR